MATAPINTAETTNMFDIFFAPLIFKTADASKHIPTRNTKKAIRDNHISAEKIQLS